MATASNLPGLGSGQRDLEIEHSVAEVKSSRPRVSIVVESPGYFDTIHLPLLLGRDFNDTDGVDGHKAAVLTRLARRVSGQAKPRLESASVFMTTTTSLETGSS